MSAWTLHLTHVLAVLADNEGLLATDVHYSETTTNPDQYATYNLARNGFHVHKTEPCFIVNYTSEIVQPIYPDNSRLVFWLANREASVFCCNTLLGV